VLALLWSLAVRDSFPATFHAFHKAVFNAKHDEFADIGKPSVLGGITASVGLHPADVAAIVASGVPAKTLAAEHTDLVAAHHVFGVPTFIAGSEATFVRFMERHNRDDVDRVVDMLTWTSLNEFKRTSIPR
jgi:2-hydroxychromene-2-carboxylate isomerase